MPPPSLPLSLSLSLSLFPVDNCDAEIMLREKLVCQRKTAKNNRSRTHQLNPALSDQITFRVGPHYQYACGRAMEVSESSRWPETAGLRSLED